MRIEAQCCSKLKLYINCYIYCMLLTCPIADACHCCQTNILSPWRGTPVAGCLRLAMSPLYRPRPSLSVMNASQISLLQCHPQKLQGGHCRRQCSLQIEFRNRVGGWVVSIKRNKVHVVWNPHQALVFSSWTFRSELHTMIAIIVWAVQHSLWNTNGVCVCVCVGGGFVWS